MILAALPSFGADGQRAQEIKIAGKIQHLVQDDQKHFCLSNGCLKPEGAWSCAAFDALKSASLRDLPVDALNGGINPGAVLCRRVSGQVVLGTDSSGNDVLLCRFKDKSLATADSLDAYANLNDSKK